MVSNLNLMSINVVKDILKWLYDTNWYINVHVIHCLYHFGNDIMKHLITKSSPRIKKKNKVFKSIKIDPTL